MIAEYERHELSNISFSEAFFEDEVREGFFVMSMIKRYWAAQLKVLSVIDGICRRHDINWFADYGTLMGAVRHEGYIPWDDDLDICMLRSDWDKFFEVAKTELPKGFVIMTLEEQEEYRELIGRVSNSHAIDYSKKHLEEYYGCPYTVGVDIFPLDGIYDDPVKEADRKARAQKVIEAYSIIQADGEKSYRLKFILQEIEKENNVRLKMGAGLERAIVLLLDRIYRECSDVGVSKVALMRFYMSHGNHIYNRKMYESSVEIPFENAFVRVPARYDEKLRLDYGDYMRVVKSGGIHDYPAYSEQEQIFRDHLGRNPYRYTMNNQALLNSVRRYIMRATAQSEKKAHRKVVFLPCRAEWWDTMEPLWKRVVADPELEVHVLPIPYNDRDFTGEFLDDHDETGLFPDYVSVEDHEEYDFEKEHPDVIVIQVPYDDWSTFMAVPDYYYSHNLLNYTNELVYIPCFEPDDSENDGDKAYTAISVLVEQPAVVNSDRVVLGSQRMKQVYMKKLVELTGEPTREYWNQKIVMVEELDWGKEIESVEADSEASFNKTVIESGSLYADMEYKDSEWMSLIGDITGKKVIIYYVTISFLLEGGSRAIDKIRQSLDTFAQNSDKIQAVLIPQKVVLTDLKRLDEELWNQFWELVQQIGNYWKNCVYDPEGIATKFIDKWDAFYGDPGTIPRQCLLKKIPVMLQNIDV